MLDKIGGGTLDRRQDRIILWQANDGGFNTTFSPLDPVIPELGYTTTSRWKQQRKQITT